MADQGRPVRIGWERLRLDLTNYRHEKMHTPDEAISYLLQKERVLELAVDIAKEGLNPLERLGIVELKGSGERSSYTSVEGNRRTCALMLLHDPQRVPTGLPDRTSIIKRLKSAAKRARLPDEMDCVVFSSKRAAKPWIDRLHVGELDGVARKRWKADQIERSLGGAVSSQKFPLQQPARSH